MSLKPVFLLVVTSAKRVGELQALALSFPCMCWLPDDSGMTLLYPGFLPKFGNHLIELAAFDEGEPTVHFLLCLLSTQDQLFLWQKDIRDPLFKQRQTHHVVDVTIRQAECPDPTSHPTLGGMIEIFMYDRSI